MGNAISFKTELRSYPHTKGSRIKSKEGSGNRRGSTEAAFPIGGESSVSIKGAVSDYAESECPPHSSANEGRIQKTTEWTVLGTNGFQEGDTVG